AGTDGVGAQLTAPTSVFPAGTGYYGVWTAPDLNNGQDYTVQVECFGAGGGGGGGSASCGGGGGGGGEYSAESYYPVTPFQGYAWVVGSPGSPGSANSGNNQSATAGGTGGTTVFDIAGLGVAGGVTAHGGQGGDVGNTGIGGAYGFGSFNTTEYTGGTGGTNLPGSGGSGSGGQGGTDNPLTLHTAGLLSAAPVAWYILNDSFSNGQINDSSGQDNPATPSGWGGNNLLYGQLGTAPQVPAYDGPADPPGSPNPTTATAGTEWPIASVNSPAGYIQTPGIFFQDSAVTISAWIYPDSSGTWGNTSGGSRALVAGNTTGYQGSGGDKGGAALYLANNGSRSNPNWTLNFYCGSNSSSHTISTSLPPNPVNNYVVATFNSGTMTLYVNGTSAVSGTAGFPSVAAGDFSMQIGLAPNNRDWFFGYISNIWFANGVLSSGGVTQAYSGSGGSSTGGGAGGGASGGPAANGGNGSSGSGSTGGTGGTPATQPATDIGINTPASAGIAGANGGSDNSGVTGGYGAGGGGAGTSSSPPSISTITVPFVTAAAYCGPDATGGSAGTVYNPVVQGTNGRLFTGGQATDAASGSKNSLLIIDPGLAATLAGNTVTRVTLTVTNANPQATQNALMPVGWSSDTSLPQTYLGSDIA
ncbi:MAG TPA: LamG domain-containing protein, partial [Trebonia sp.]|nr:LamG domain-containing protein [Trebonia sp.]